MSNAAKHANKFVLGVIAFFIGAHLCAEGLAYLAGKSSQWGHEMVLGVFLIFFLFAVVWMIAYAEYQDSEKEEARNRGYHD